MIKANQPDFFFPWLERFVAAGSPWGCDGTTVGLDGTLCLHLTGAGQQVDLMWDVGTPREDKPTFRGGSLWVERASSTDPRLGKAALRHVAARLTAMFHKHTPALLTRRNRELVDVRFGPGLLESLCGEILCVGQTRRADHLLAEATHRDRAFELRFRSSGSELLMHLVPRGAPAKGEVVRDYGPCALCTARMPASDAERSILDFVGYVLALSMHPQMRFIEDAAGSARSDAGAQRLINPFLHDAVPADISLMNALQGCSGGLSMVAHSDRECLSYCPLMTGPSQSLYLTRPELRPNLEFLRRLRLTDLSEQAVIMSGGEGALASLLQETIEQDEPALLVAIDSCVPRLIGDDSVAVVQQARREHRNLPTINVEIRLDEADNQRAFWRDLVRELSQSKARTPGKAVNLIGFGSPRTRSLPELQELLSSMSVRTNACVVPTFDIDEMRRFRDADLNLVFPAKHVREAFELAQPECGVVGAEAAAPFGLEGTRAWLLEVANLLAVEPPGEPFFQQRMSSLRARWDALARRAAGHRVGVVLLDCHFREPDCMVRMGVPWLGCLDEMGFALEVMVVRTHAHAGSHERDFQHARQRLGEVLRSHSGLSVTKVDALDALGDLLRKGKFELVYTEVAQDRRVTTAGKVPVSPFDFEMGFQGGLRTLRRLLNLAETPFFQRYHQHLPPADWKP
ncbi:MAG: hypothetical protein HY898_30755 [Deltaproteobacteria bacterium]|nr:hypothetical protein [Deltaproteobacteria bacterium]